MIPVAVRILVCTEPVDMRYGFDRLASTAKSRIGEDPQHGGVLVVFANRGATRLKVLWFDRNGVSVGATTGQLLQAPSASIAPDSRLNEMPSAPGAFQSLAPGPPRDAGDDFRVPARLRPRRVATRKNAD